MCHRTDNVRSENLAKIAAQNVLSSSVVADVLTLPHPLSSFDFAISIAVIHHLSTRQRRVKAVESVLGTLHVPKGQTKLEFGRALIFVWALEQKQSRRGWGEGDEQDVLVPWIRHDAGDPHLPGRSTTFQRYYHLYRRGELEEDITEAGGVVVDSGYERDNWWAIAYTRPPRSA